jgi:hypothetical protein
VDVADPGAFLQTLHDPVAQFVDHPKFVVPILGDDIQLPITRIYHPTVAVQNTDELAAQLETGETIGLRVEFAPTDGTGFRAFVPSRWADPKVDPVPEPWGLVNVGEDSSFQEPS